MELIQIRGEDSFVLESRSFNRATDDACEAVAGMCRRLCTEFVDPTSLQALLSCRLIPLDKNLVLDR